MIDTLPEKTRYRDTGCNLHPKCLTCPLAVCRYDEPPGSRLAKLQRAAMQLRSDGMEVNAIASVLGVSRRQAYRALGVP